MMLACALSTILYCETAQARLGGGEESIWKEISTRPDCTPFGQTSEVLVFSCKKDITLWYFTRPGTPAHPGVIKRGFESNQNGGTESYVDATSFGSDEDQPAFKALFDKLSELDKQMRDYVKEHSTPDPKPK